MSVLKSMARAEWGRSSGSRLLLFCKSSITLELGQIERAVLITHSQAASREGKPVLWAKGGGVLTTAGGFFAVVLQHCCISHTEEIKH